MTNYKGFVFTQCGCLHIAAYASAIRTLHADARTPSPGGGGRITRRFPADALVQAVFDWIDLARADASGYNEAMLEAAAASAQLVDQAVAGSEFSLVANFPRRLFTEVCWPLAAAPL
eukprot:SAG31_NODE_1188_length_9481_cov_14.760819_2_plen_117_part_00